MASPLRADFLFRCSGLQEITTWSTCTARCTCVTLWMNSANLWVMPSPQQPVGMPISITKTFGQKHKGRHTSVAFSYFNNTQAQSCKTEWAGPVRTPGLPGSQEAVVISGGLADKLTLFASCKLISQNKNVNLQRCVQLRGFNIFKLHKNSLGAVLAYFLNWESSESLLVHNPNNRQGRDMISYLQHEAGRCSSELAAHFSCRDHIPPSSPPMSDFPCHPSSADLLWY